MSASVAELIAEAIVYVENQSTATQIARIARLRALTGRLAAARLQVAVLGQFKRGKSSLLNALLRVPVLPIGVLPATALATFLSYAASPVLRLEFLDGTVEERTPGDVADLQAQLAALVTEQGNPENHLGLARVEAGMPAALLERGVVLLDTPGIGSTLRHNTETARAALAECDVALFVVSPDPPITEAERLYLAEIGPAVARLAVVLNKSDTVDDADRARSVEFLRKVLTEQAGLAADVAIFPASARAGLRAGLVNDRDGLAASGLAAIEGYLADLIDGEDAEVLASAVAAKAGRVVGAMRMEIELELRALRMPLEELAERIARFEAALGGFEDERRSAADQIAGDRRRLSARLEEAAERLSRQAEAELRVAGEAALDNGGDLTGARAALAALVPGLFGPGQRAVVEDIEQALLAALARHQDRADGLVESVRQTAAALMDLPYDGSDRDDPPELPRLTAWVVDGRTETFTSLTVGAFEPFVPGAARRHRRRIGAEAEALTRRNVEDLRWTLRQKVDEACRRFAASLDERLNAALAATHGAMETALQRRSDQAVTVQVLLTEREETVRHLARIQDALGERASAAG
jgi:GTP-binding protein EngB required for normal cell division